MSKAEEFLDFWNVRNSGSRKGGTKLIGVQRFVGERKPDVGTVILVGALTFLPALALGPIVEHFLMLGGRTF